MVRHLEIGVGELVSHASMFHFNACTDVGVEDCETSPTSPIRQAHRRTQPKSARDQQ